MNARLQIMLKVVECIKDPIARLESDRCWVVRNDFYVIRMSTSANRRISPPTVSPYEGCICVHKHIVEPDGRGSAPLIPMYAAIPLCDPGCFEKVTEAVNELIREKFSL